MEKGGSEKRRISATGRFPLTSVKEKFRRPRVFNVESFALLPQSVPLSLLSVDSLRRPLAAHTGTFLISGNPIPSTRSTAIVAILIFAFRTTRNNSLRSKASIGVLGGTGGIANSLADFFMMSTAPRPLAIHTPTEQAKNGTIFL